LAKAAHGVDLFDGGGSRAASLHNRNQPPGGLKNPPMAGFLTLPAVQVSDVVNNQD
jgi:hypothetical protein